MNPIVATSICVIALSVSGCSDPKKPTEANFKTAINDWIETQPRCISVPMGRLSSATSDDAPFPRYVAATPVTNESAKKIRKREQAPFEALVGVGLLEREKTTLEVKANVMGDETKEVEAYAYDLSNSGQEQLSEGEEGLFSSAAQQFCYGSATVDEIIQFTEPADTMGVTFSQVSYRYHIKDLPSWAKDKDMQKAFSELERDTADDLKTKTALVLTNKGWVHEKAADLY